MISGWMRASLALALSKLSVVSKYDHNSNSFSETLHRSNAHVRSEHNTVPGRKLLVLLQKTETELICVEEGGAHKINGGMWYHPCIYRGIWASRRLIWSQIAHDVSIAVCFVVAI